MKIVVVGGTGLMGAHVVSLLRQRGHDVVAASRATGFNAYTGEGVADALEGTATVIDVSNSSYTDGAAAREYFYASTLNLLTFGADLGVRHHVALSLVNTSRLAVVQGGYFAAKAEQEKLILTAGRPYTLVQSTQFFEFLRSIAVGIRGGASAADVLVQPIAACDVATTIAHVSEIDPTNGVVEVAGPEIFQLGAFAEREQHLLGVESEIVADPLGTYEVSRLGVRDLLPSPAAQIGPTTLSQWRWQTTRV